LPTLSQAISERRARTVVIALVAFVVASTFAYWGYGEYRKRELYKAVVGHVTDASARLRDALSIGMGAPSIDAYVTQRLEDHAKEVERRFEELRRMSAAPNRALVDAAELYMVTARELLRRTASSHRYRATFSSSAQMLVALTQHASGRSGSWIAQMVSAKEQAERDYSNYRGALDAIGRLLDSLPDARRKLAVHVDPAVLLEESLRANAREQALEASQRAADELERARQFWSRR